jgi:hemophore-related protein
VGLRRALYGVFTACLAGDTHPDTNAALTAAAQQPVLQAVAALKTYFDSNTQAGKDIQAPQQPLQNLSGRCRLSITLPQILQFMQAAPNGAALPAGLPPATGPGVP